MKLKTISFFIVLTFLSGVVSCARNSCELPILDYEPSPEVYPVYFADSFHEDGLVLHFRWRPDFKNYSHAFITDASHHILAKVPYPYDTVRLPEGTEDVYVIASAQDGKQSEAVAVDMTRTYDELKETGLEAVRIRKGPDGCAGFYLEDSGKEIILRGVNYCRITTGDHDTFEPDYGPAAGCYDPLDAETMFRTIKEYGYNYVRVFIKTGQRNKKTLGLSGPSSTRGIWNEYMDNFINFMRRAHSYGIYVLPCFCENEMLSNDYFQSLSKGATKQGILFSKDGIKAKQEYMTLFFNYIRKNAPELVNTLVAVTMQNEFSFKVTEAPFNQMEGTYRFYDGSEYDMADDVQRRELANHAMGLYYKAMKETVEKCMPGLPMGEGTYALHAVGKTYDNSFGIKPIPGVKDVRYPMTVPEYLRTSIDFLDFHIYRRNYLGSAAEVFGQVLENMHATDPEALKMMKEKPVIMGEFGTMHHQETTVQEAIAFARGLQQSALDFGFKGHCIWTIDTFEQDRPRNLMADDAALLKNL